MAQQFKDSVTLLTDIKFNWKEGTHKTLFKVISWLKFTVPVEVTEAEDPVGKLIWGIDEGSTFVKCFESEMMWSVAPLSKIQELVNTELAKALKGEHRLATFV